uniref:IgGFc_binding domain-containing protein n=1 Tax=Strongyloides venezuelensis TaxID=75913 RepID=A0A0K0EWD7_STRVS
MKISSITSIIFILSLTILGYGIPDSDGTKFITSFLYKDATNSSNFSLYLYFITSVQNPGPVTVRYLSLVDMTMKITSVTPEYGKVTRLQFNYNDVISEGHLSSGTPLNVTDPRIFIDSITPVKVIGHLFNRINNQGDMYIVPPLTFAGTTYLVKLPKTSLGKLQLLHIMALENQNVNVEMIASTQGSNLTSIQNFTINGTAGSPQKIVSSILSGSKKSYYFKASGPIIITAAVNGADLNGYLVNSNATVKPAIDYTAFVPQPIGVWDMKTMLTPKDKRVTVAENTVALDVSPSDVMGYNKLPILTFNNLNTTNGVSAVIPIQQVSEYAIDHSQITEFATQSSHAVAVWTRIGSPSANSNATLNGMYIHYIPESTQFYSGETQFITLFAGDYYEVYVENYTVGASLTLNGQNVLINDQTSRNLGFFNKTYTVVKITVPIAGLNVFNCSLNYIGYVISKTNGYTNTAYGYLTGFNKSKLQTYWASNETTTTTTTTTITTTTTPASSGITTTEGNKIYTTTKSASKMNLNLITISLLLISKIFLF